MIQSYAPQTSIVFMGLSTDTKPAAGIGSKFIETDTSKVFIYMSTPAWVQVGVLASTTDIGVLL